MDEDRIAGTAKNVAGRAQEGFGRVTGDAKSQVEGAARQVAGAAQDFYGQAKDTAADAAKAVREHASDAEDFLRRTIESRPYTAAAIALAARQATPWLDPRLLDVVFQASRRIDPRLAAALLALPLIACAALHWYGQRRLLPEALQA